MDQRIKAGKPIARKWYERDNTVALAREMIGLTLCRRMPDGSINRLMIHETEAYDGPEDRACHAHGNRRTKRTAVMFERGGLSYIYLCYGIHWLLNIVTGPAEYPAAVLIRGAGAYDGPGKLTRATALDGELNQKALNRTNGLWLEDPGTRPFKNSDIVATPRIGIDYAGPQWSMVEYRFVLNENQNV